MKKHNKNKYAKYAAVPLALLMAAGAGIGFAGKSSAADRAMFQDYNYYTFDYNNGDELKAAAKELNGEICAEGFTLLKNDGLLPVSPKAGQSKIKTSVFGNHSARVVYKGFGSSSQGTGLETSLYSVLESSVFELNPQLKAFYNDDSRSGAKINPDTAVDPYYMGVPSYETPIASYTDDIKSSYADYNDLAVVVLSRWAGEGSDLSTVSLKQDFTERNDANKQSGARHWDDHYLQLDANEVAMLQMVMDNFDDVLIVMNGSSYIELGFLNDPTHYLYTDNDYTADAEEAAAKMQKLKGLITISYPGTDGLKPLPDILTGKINPSGHLVDTWVKDLKSDPTFQNCGSSGQTYSELRNGEFYVHYDEDIYMGYRYYETRYITEGDDKDEWYDRSVMYPFGYGLSYTDFEWELVDPPQSGTPLDKDGKISVSVKVTNTGSVAGKDVVQLYYSAPYFTGGISKAHVNIGGFKKTDLLAPGESQMVTVEMNVRDMRSYDWSDANKNGIKGYELDAGEYKIIAAHDAHDAAKLPQDRTVVYTLADGVYYDTDAETGAVVKNLFDYASGTGKTNDPAVFKGVRQYLSRDDFEGTFPTHSSQKRDGKAQGKQQFEQSEKFDMTQPWHVDEMPKQAATPGTSVTNTVKLWQMKGRDYDDPLWDDLLDQLTVEEMANQVGNGFRGPRPIPSIDKPEVWDTDGPLGRRESTDIQWCANTVLAQTFNPELAYEQGVVFGNVAFTGPTARGGTYGIGLDIHRSAFAGRFFEYYSEDGFICGIFGAECVKGANSKGCYQIVKHLMLNDMETQRNTIQTWASEQAIREIYGKGFEMAIKAGALGIMTGVNSIGDIPCAMNYNLLTSLIRDEWGFKGFVITDMYCEDTNICMRAGIDTMMSHPNPKNPHTEQQYLTPTHVQSMRNACKHIFYAMANSNGINGVGGTERLDKINYIGADSLYTVVNVDNGLSVGTAVVGTNADAKLKYALAEGSALPEGLTLESDGSITGTPNQSGTYQFSVVCSENSKAYYPYKDVKKSFRLTVYGKDEIPGRVIYEDIDLGTLAYGYEFAKSIAGAAVFDESGALSKNITYKLASGSELPAGLELKDGLITGKVEAAPGTYFFTVEAACDGKESAFVDFIVTVKAFSIDYPPAEIPRSIKVGQSVSININTATSENGISVSYAVKDGSKLPEGLRLLSSGEIIGTPTRAYNDHEFAIIATGRNARPQEVTYRMTVQGLVFDDVTFDGLIIGKDYSFKLDAEPNNGKYAPVYFELKEGSTLPEGIHLLADGTVFGRGKNWGKQSFTVVAKSEGNVDVEATVTLDFYSIFDDPVDDAPELPTPALNGGSNLWVLGVVLPIVVLLIGGGATAAFILLKRKKSAKAAVVDGENDVVDNSEENSDNNKD